MPFALCKNVLAIGSRRLTFDGETTLLHSQPIFLHRPHKVFHAAASTGWNRRIFLLKLFNLSALLLKKLLKTYVGPYRSCKSNRKTGTSRIV